MEIGYYSIADIKAMILNGNGRYYYVGHDSYGNYIEIEFEVISKHKTMWIVDVQRFYTSYLNRITKLDDTYTFHIPNEDFDKIRRKSRYF